MPPPAQPGAWQVAPDAAGQRLVDHLRAHLAVVALREVGPLIASGNVTVNDVPGAIADTVSEGDRIAIDAGALTAIDQRRRLTTPVDLGLPIVYEDADLLVVDKPAGMHIAPVGGHGSASVLAAMLWHGGARPDWPWSAWRPHVVHRLDRAASGLLIVAKGHAPARTLGAMVTEGAIHRTYLARVIGHVATEAGTVDAPLGPDPEFDYRRAPVALADGGQAAVTHWRVVQRSTPSDQPATTTLEVTIETGRTHQIRAHLASIGHGIVGDTLYSIPAPDRRHPTAKIATLAAAAGDAIALHATRLSFAHPRDGHPVTVQSTPPSHIAGR